MGQAKNRGIFEERKAQAIATGNKFYKAKQAKRMNKLKGKARKNAVASFMLEALLFSKFPGRGK